MQQIQKDIFETFLEEGLPKDLANLMTAQCTHESGNFKSNVFKKNNNLNGYKYVGQKLATRGTRAPKSEGDYYAKYATVQDSARELAHWIKRRQQEGKFPEDLTTIKSASTYAALLKKAGYYGDTVSNYTAGLKRYLEDFSV